MMWKQLKTELFKIRKDPFFIFFILFPIVFFFYGVSNSERLFERVSVLSSFWGRSFSEGFYAFLMQKVDTLQLIVIVVIAYHFFRAEIRNKCCNQLLTTPVKPAEIYAAKMAVLVLCVIAQYILIAAFFSFMPLIFNNVHVTFIRGLVIDAAGSAMLVMLQYSICLCTRKFVPYMLAFAVILAASIIFRTFAAISPYGISFISAIKGESLLVWRLLSYSAVAVVLGSVMFKRNLCK